MKRLPGQREGDELLPSPDRGRPSKLREKAHFLLILVEFPD
jgi:hypothetical protein